MADRPREIIPSAFGARNWHPMSFNPQTGLAYMPVQGVPITLMDNKDWKFNAAAPLEPHSGLGWNLGQFVNAEPPKSAPFGRLVAWDPVAQKARWTVEHVGPWNGGTLTTAGNLVFQGRSNGFLVAYRATDGQELWKSWAATGIIAAPMTYELDGVQYVTVAAGWGGAFGLAQPDPARSGLKDPGQIVTFQLGGRAASAPTATAAAAPSPASLPVIPDPGGEERVAAGEQLYATWCASCHGAEATGGGIVPDLRRSSRATFGEYTAIVLEGSRQETGMPSLEGKLDADQVAAIRSYVIERRDLLAGRKQ